MATEVAKELAALQRMGAAARREKYAQVFGEATTTGNRTWLVRRIAWRLQAPAEGDLQERARRRAACPSFRSRSAALMSDDRLCVR